MRASVDFLADEAQRLVADKIDSVYGPEWDGARNRNLAEAQVHATLALVQAVRELTAAVEAK